MTKKEFITLFEAYKNKDIEMSIDKLSFSDMAYAVSLDAYEYIYDYLKEESIELELIYLLTTYKLLTSRKFFIAYILDTVNIHTDLRKHILRDINPGITSISEISNIVNNAIFKVVYSKFVHDSKYRDTSAEEYLRINNVSVIDAVELLKENNITEADEMYIETIAELHYKQQLEHEAITLKVELSEAVTSFNKRYSYESLYNAYLENCQ